MCITAYCIARKRGHKGTGESFPSTACRAIWDGKWALATPVIILGGIYCGAYLPHRSRRSERALDAVRRPVRLPQADVNISSAIRTSAFAGSATVLAGRRLNGLLAAPDPVHPHPSERGCVPRSISTDPTITLLLIAFFIFLCGFVADTLAMVVVLAPVFCPSRTPRHPSDPARRAVRGAAKPGS